MHDEHLPPSYKVNYGIFSYKSFTLIGFYTVTDWRFVFISNYETVPLSVFWGLSGLLYNCYVQDGICINICSIFVSICREKKHH